MSCPLCGHEGQTLATLPASITSEAKSLNAPSRLMLCPACGHVFTHADVDWHTYYSDTYDATLTDDGLDELVVAADGQTQFRTDFDYALFRRMAKPTGRLLEVGFGRGRILSRLHRDGFADVWACDVSERYREAAARLIGDARVSIGALPPGPFDVIASFFMLEHDTDPLRTLRSLSERLRGAVFAMVPSFCTNLGDLACADHVNHFTPESLANLFGAAGLEVTAVDDSAPGTLAVTARRAQRRPLQNLEPHSRAAVQPFIATLAHLEQLPQRLDPDRRVFLYGAGFHAALAAGFLPKVSGVYDANPRKQGLQRLGHTVAAPSAICEREHRDDCLLVCINAKTAGAIAAQYGHAFGQVLTLG